jgi:hypothetical protein
VVQYVGYERRYPLTAMHCFPVGILFYDNSIVGGGEIWTLDVSVGNIRNCQLSYKALGLCWHFVWVRQVIAIIDVFSVCLKPRFAILVDYNLYRQAHDTLMPCLAFPNSWKCHLLEVITWSMWMWPMVFAMVLFLYGACHVAICGLANILVLVLYKDSVVVKYILCHHWNVYL